MKYSCPLGTDLPTVPGFDCEMNLDQTLRAAIFRKTNSDPLFTPTALITALASWTALLGTTQALITPIFDSFVIPPSEVQTEAGNTNATPFGVARVMGHSAVTPTGNFTGVPQHVIDAIRKVTPHTFASMGKSRAGIIPINRYGQVMVKQVLGADGQPIADTYDAIPFYNFTVGSRSTQGLNAKDINAFSFELPEYWDSNIVILDVDFDALVDLNDNPTTTTTTTA